MTVQLSAEAIQNQMRSVRREVSEDVEEIVESARTMTDWRHYVRRYPLVAVGAAAVVGYLVVPPRYRIAVPVSTPAKAAAEEKTAEQASTRGAITGAVMSLVTSAAMRAASSWFSGQVTRYADQHFGKLNPFANDAKNGADSTSPADQAAHD